MPGYTGLIIRQWNAGKAHDCGQVFSANLQPFIKDFGVKESGRETGQKETCAGSTCPKPPAQKRQKNFVRYGALFL